MENSVDIPQEIKSRTTIWSSKPTSGYLTQENKTTVLRDICTSTFTTVKTGKQTVSIARCVDTEDWYTYATERYWLYAEGNPAICHSIDETWGPYATWNNSDRERQILYDLTHMWNRKKTTTNSQEQSRMVLAGGGGSGKWGRGLSTKNVPL